MEVTDEIKASLLTCGDYISSYNATVNGEITEFPYYIDSRLDFEMLDRLAGQQLSIFENNMSNTTKECDKYRAALTCSLAFPQCQPDKSYVYFPCQNVCKNYEKACGGASSWAFNNYCDNFPTTDCVPSSILLKDNTENIGNTLLPSIVLMFGSIVLILFV